MEYITNGEEETQELGRRLGERLGPGAVVAFTGDLGAGKTAFTRGIARGLGIGDRVTSPTFAIVNEYEGGRLPLFVSLSCAYRAQASTLFPLSVVSALSALSVKTFFVPFASDRTVRFSLTHTSAGPDGLVISAPSR